MRLIKKILLGVGVLLGLLVLAVVGLVVYVQVSWDKTFELPATGITASTDPEVIARGEYLVQGPLHCTACHVTGHQEAFGTPPDQALVPAGGQEWNMGPLWTLRAANLTPDPETGIGRYSDEHLARVIKYGVGEDGKLRPFMAVGLSTVPDEEIRAVISYLRSLPAVKREIPKDELKFVGKALIAIGAVRPRGNTALTRVAPTAEPTVERGEYLARGPAMCQHCHSPVDMMDGLNLVGAAFSGCFEPEPGTASPEKMEICPPNLTPHPTAGHITGWTEEAFVGRMKSGFSHPETRMPWRNFARMTDSDIRSIYRFLRTLPPVDRVTGPPIRERKQG